MFGYLRRQTSLLHAGAGSSLAGPARSVMRDCRDESAARRRWRAPHSMIGRLLIRAAQGDQGLCCSPGVTTMSAVTTAAVVEVMCLRAAAWRA